MTMNTTTFSSSILLDVVATTTSFTWPANMSSTVESSDNTFWAPREPNNTLEWFSYIVEGVLLSGISLVGCFANVFTILGLARNRKTRSFTKHLIALAIFDLLYLLMALAIFGLPKISEWYRHTVYSTLLPICYGLAHMGRVGSCLLTLSVTIERYLTVCHPMRDVCLIKKQWLLPFTVVFALVYNVPKLFEFEHDEQGNVVPTRMRNNPVYIIVYFFWSKFLLVELIPYVLLIALNFRIWRSVRTLASLNRRREQEERQGGVQDEELELAGILIALVSIFIFCQSFKLLPDVYEVVTCSHSRMRRGACEGLVIIEYVIDTSHCLLAFNSSVNFFIYVIMGGKFRQIILEMFRDMGARWQQQTHGNNGRHYEMVLRSEKRNNGTNVEETKNKGNNLTKDEECHNNVLGNRDQAVHTPFLTNNGEREKNESCDEANVDGIKKQDDDQGGHQRVVNAPMEIDPQIFRRWPLTMYDMPVIIVQHHPDNQSIEGCAGAVATTTTTLASYAPPRMKSKARKHFRFWKNSPSRGSDSSSNLLAVNPEHTVKRAKSQPVCGEDAHDIHFEHASDLDRLDAIDTQPNPSGVSI